MTVMSEEDPGIDRQKLLDEIIGLATPPPAPAPVFAEETPPAPAEPGPSWNELSSLDPSVGPLPEVVGEPASSPASFPASAPWIGGRFLNRRREWAALVTIFAGVVWAAAGLGAREGWAVLVGVAFLGAGALALAAERQNNA